MMSDKNPISELCDKVRETSFSPHSFLRHGQKGSIHENDVGHRPGKQGIHVKQQLALQVLDIDGATPGDLQIDLLIGSGAPNFEIRKFILSQNLPAS